MVSISARFKLSITWQGFRIRVHSLRCCFENYLQELWCVRCQVASTPSHLPDSVLGMVWKVAFPTELVVNIRQCCLTQLSEDAIAGSDIITQEKNAIGNGLSCSFSFFRACSREVYYLHRGILGTQDIGCVELAILPKAACPGKIEGWWVEDCRMLLAKCLKKKP